MGKTVTVGTQAFAQQEKPQNFLRREMASIKEHPRLYKLVAASMLAAVETDSVKSLLSGSGMLIQISPSAQEAVSGFLQNALYSFPALYGYCMAIDYGMLTGMAVIGAAVYRFAGRAGVWMRLRTPGMGVRIRLPPEEQRRTTGQP